MDKVKGEGEMEKRKRRKCKGANIKSLANSFKILKQGYPKYAAYQ
jgi:hypothetical protein